MTRRRLLADLGQLAVGAVVLGTAAVSCTSDGDTGTAGNGTPAEAGWSRVDLGFVSAYVLVRAGEAVVIDTGVSDSEGDIEATLADLGVGWSDVANVILTHKHPDHVGSVEAVLNAAVDTQAYAGEADIPAIASPREISAVGDGDRVAGLEIVATPGHTAGHVSVLDPAGAVLFAGDALNGDGGDVVGPNPQFSEDMDVAWESVAKLGGLAFDTVVFGHGPPVEGDAAAKVAALER